MCFRTDARLDRLRAPSILAYTEERFPVLQILFTIIHVVVCLFLVIVVLLQSGKAADLAGAFGGMGSQTAFGPRGAATVLSKATTIAAAVFMLTSLSLAIVATRNAGTATSVLERQKAGTQQKSTANVPTPVPTAPPAAAPGAGQSAPAGQPRVELIPEGSDKPIQTIPLDINKLPRVNPDQAKPAKPAPTK
jgi:preprotein translocase subunit SecG